MWTGSTGSGEGPVVGSCEQSNKPLGFIKSVKFHDQLSDYQHFKENPAAWT
jgi:hypothetical protein